MKKLNILLIEDNRNDVELACRNLKGHTVTVALTLKEGLEALDDSKYDVVLLDLHLTNGIKHKVLDQVNDKRGEAATVILTGDVNPRTRDKMLMNGADGFMVKGTDDKSPDDMRYVLAVAIEHRKGIK